MNSKHASGALRRHVASQGYPADYGHRIEPIACDDESELGESMVMAGFRRAESERSAAAEGFLRSRYGNVGRRIRNF